MSKLLVMCGIPGSGKSTWAKHFIEENDAVIVSRDSIRFSMLQEGEEYFSREEEVTTEYYKQLNDLIADNGFEYIIADATHNTPKARKYMLSQLNLKNVDIIPVYFSTSVEECVRRNNMREGLAKVPSRVIYQMANNRSKPDYNEFYTYFDIWEVNE